MSERQKEEAGESEGMAVNSVRRGVGEISEE